MQKEALRGYRLSPQQRRLWNGTRREWDASYQTKCMVAIKGRLESGYLKTAAKTVLERHEILRTTFQCLPRMTVPMQVIEETGDIGWLEDDLSGLDEQTPLIESIFHTAFQPFDFERGPFLYLHLIKRAADDYVLILRLPAVCADSVSLRNLVDELSRSYAAAKCGEELDGEAPQYADLAEWQNELVESEETRDGREYWNNRALLGRLALQLPFEGGATIDAAFEPRLDELVIAPPIAARIESVARDRETSLEQILLACWQILLWRYTGQSEIEIGTVLDGRRASETENALGLFAKCLPITCHLDEELPFTKLIEQLDQCLMTAQDWQEYFSWEQLVGPSDSAPGASFFPFCFELQTAPGSFLAGDVSFTIFKQYACIDRFKIKLSYARRAEGLVVEFHYNSRLFRPADIQYLIALFHTLLGNVTANPLAKLGDLEMVVEAERRRLLVEWNETGKSYPEDQRLHELLEQQVERTPEAVALIYEDLRLSYAELNAKANQLARYLQRLGIGPERLVGVCAERSLEMVIGLLAVLKAGGAYVPLDPTYPAERLAYMLEDSAPVVVLTHTRLRAEIRSALAQAGVPMIDLEADAWRWANETDVNRDEPAVELTREHLAYVIYTSGSTGRPKGVMNEHRGVVNRLFWMQDAYGLTEDDAVLQKTPFGFDVSVWEFFWPLLNGARLVMARPEGHKDPAYLASAIEQERITTLHFVPSMLQAFLESGEAARCSSLARVICSGESLSGSSVRRFRQQLTTARLYNLYGPTEAAVDVTAWDCAAEVGRESIPIGRPIANTQIYLLDGNVEAAPVGVSGEIHIGGVQVGRGYLKRPELTAERFVPCPFGVERNTRMYKTGDLGRYLPDGNIEFLGRNDFQVKIRGFRIELGEIEARLTQHPAIKEAVVLTRENGSGDLKLVAYYTRRRVEASAFKVDAEDLRAHLLTALPEYMAPAAYVALEALPLTPNGKLDRRALPAPDSAAHNSHEYEAPVGAIETALARIWAEALGLERVGRFDNFFKLGGHSLLAVRLFERMRREGLHADVRAIFATPTLAALASAVGDESGVIDVPPNGVPPECEAITPEMLPLVEMSAAEIERIVSAVPGGAANVQDIYPLAPLQEGILFHHLTGGEGDVYLMSALLAFDSRGRLEGFLRALQAVIDRHDILRTAVLWEGLPEPVQVVWRRAPLTVEEVSVGPMAGDVAGELRARYDPRRRRIDISRAPLMRVYIAEDQREGRWVALCLFHHLSIDHTGLEVLLEEVRAHLLGREEELPAPLPFRNFVAQARLGVSRQEHEEFFRRMLGDVDEPTAPYGLIDVQGDGLGIKEARREVDAELGNRLRERARALGVSAASLCHLAWAVVLARVSGREDVVFGTVLFGRMQGGRGADRVLGVLINTLPARIRVGDQSVEEGVRQTHALLTHLMRHEHAPLALAQRCSAVGAPAPLFSALLNYRHGATLTEADPGYQRAWEGVTFLDSEERVNYPFCLNVDDLGAGFRLNAQAQSPVEPDRICAYMHAALERLVEALEHAPTAPLHGLNVLTDSERHQLLVEWNATETEYPHGQYVHELFAGQAERNPERTALSCEGLDLSYRELNRRSNQLGRHLRKLGVGPEVMVGICLERSLEMVIGLLGILKAGGTYVPMDMAYPDQRLNMMVDDAGIRLLITQGHLAARFEDRAINLVCLDKDWSVISTESPEDFEAKVTLDNSAYVIYTSGSTGRPKGVVVTHRSVSNLFNAVDERLHFNERDVWTLFHSYSFDFSVWEIWGALIYGGTLVVVPSLVARSPEDFWNLVRAKGVTILSQTPSAFRHFIGVDEMADAAGDSSLRAVIFGGEALEFQSLRGWMERRGAASPYLINMYGITETTVHTTYKRVTCEEVRESSGSVIGKPLANVRMYVFDDRMQPAPVGVAGELYVAGEGVARGYIGREDLTAERFMPALYGQDPGERVYKTGDLARYLGDGNVEYLGRKDQQVKIRGYRIELGEIKSALLQHKAISEAAVIDRAGSDGDKKLVAYLVNRSGARLVMSELRAYLRQVLPDYMAPAEFVLMEKLPLTPNGKLDRKVLPEPGRERGEGEPAYASPRTPAEEILVGIFEEVLKLDRIGIRDNFFEIGGHSLLATQVISRVRGTFGLEIEVRSIFENPTAAGLAGRIEDAIRGEEYVAQPPLIRVSKEGRKDVRLPLSFAQQRLWFLDRFMPNNPIYNNPGAVRLEGKLDLDALERVINEIVRRHEALRTRFEIEAGAPLQVIDAWEPRRLEVTDLTSLPSDEKEAEASRIAKEEAEIGFDLSRGPLLRVKALKLEEDEHVLLYTMHHIVSDGWSMGILSREVGELYRAYSRGESSPLPELPIQYGDFAVWQREWLQGEALERQIEYWRKQLAGLEELELPTDHPRPVEQSYRGASRHFVIERELAEGLKGLGQREGVTLFMTLLGGFSILMSRYSGQSDVVVGTDIANRNRAEIEGLIGFFVNQLVLRVEVSAEESFSVLLKRVRDICLGAYGRQDLPFEKLVEELQPERDLGRAPLFQAKLILQNAPGGGLDLEGIKLGSASRELQMAGEMETARFDLTVAITDGGRELVGTVNYNRDLFEAETIELLMSRYTNVLRSIVEKSGRPICELSLMSEAEGRRIVVEWNETERPYPNDHCIHELFAEQTKRTPDLIALICEERQVSYGELDRQTNQLGRYLQGLGVGPEVVVGLCLERSVDLVVALLGVLKAGGAYLPLDPELPLERLSYMLEDAGVGVALTRRELEERMPTFWGRTVLMDEEWERIGEESENEPASDVMPDDLAYVIYTSGSTGDPKGIAVHHQALVARTVALLEVYDLTSADHLLQFISPSFDVFAEEVFTALSCGASLLIDRNAVNYSAHDFFDLVERQTITALRIPPAYWRRLVDELSSSRRQVSSQLRLFMTGGESPSAETVRKWATLTERQSRFVNAYGPAEATITSTAYGTRMDSSRIDLQTRVPIGRPIANTQVYILDPNRGVAPIGMRGELYIGGAGVARGYLGRVEMSAEKYVPHPFNGEVGARLYRTGDVGRYLEDGEIEFLGRTDEQVKVRGYRIEPGEIESVLNEHRSVKQSVVVAIEDERGDRRLVGYVVREGEVTGEELRRHLREKVPAYMAPAVYVFLDALPITPNGKVDRRALPQPGATGDAREYEAPVGDIEMALARIWAEAFHLDRVGRHDNFFALGGHSLMAVDMIERMRNEGLQTDVRTLFISPTIAELAAGMKKIKEITL